MSRLADDPPDVQDHAQALLQRGYTVVHLSHPPRTVAALREAILRVYRQYDSPIPYSPRDESLAPDVQLSPTGFVLTRLLSLLPDLADELFSPNVIEIARRVLGRTMHLELTGAVLSDRARPFFSWHNHIGGIDVEDYRARSLFPRFTRPERLITVLYLDDITEDGGELRAYPRRISDPTIPPFDRMQHSWPGQTPLHFPAGSTVIFEQCTWHAVMPKLSPGQRVFVGAYLTSDSAPETQLRDESLRDFTGGGELLRSLLRSTR